MQHTQKVNDRDPYFEVDAITRKIMNKSTSKVSVIQYDHNSERFTFSLPRYIEDHDMLESTKAEVHYICAKSQTKGIYEMTDLAVDPDDENKVICTWLLSQNVTLETGAINFLLRFSCIAEDGTIEYAWNTAIFTGISVAEGIYNTDAIIEQYADILEQWKNDLFSESAEGVENINTAKDAALNEISDKQNEIEAASAKAVEDINTAKDAAIDTISEIAGGEVFANALKGSASGELVSVTDISPIEHNISVQLSSDTITDFSTTKVTVCGKNVFNQYAEPAAYGGGSYYGIEITDLVKKLKGTLYYARIALKEGKTIPSGRIVIISIKQSGNIEALPPMVLNGNIDNELSDFTSWAKQTDTRQIMLASLGKVENFKGFVDAFDIQIGTRETYSEKPPVEPYIGSEFIPNADGTVENAKSVYPVMNVFTETSGVNIDCEYNKDTNKVIENLTNAIISLGGNI